MNLSLGIVGLPNVGKSTLFNALTAQEVPAENFPFTTIEPNVGIVPVNDPRLDTLATIERSERTVSAIVKFVDIAGLVRGASKGEGLGNKFLAHIREVDAIVQVIRSFESGDVVHVDKSIDPLRDKETIQAELIIRDTETIEKRIETGDNKRLPEWQKQKECLQNLLEHLNGGKLAYDFDFGDDQDIKNIRKELSLLTDKPMLYVVNEAQENITPEIKKKMQDVLQLPDEKNIIVIDIKLESEIAVIDSDEQEGFLKELGLSERPIDTLIRASYNILGLLSFFTAGEKEARAWTIYNGETIVDAAGTIHTDFADKFIAADVVHFDDFVQYGGWAECKEKGKIHLEGREYVVKDGDVVIIRHGA